MKTAEIASVLDEFEKAAAAVAALRVRVRRGSATPEDICCHAARAAVQFFFDTIGKRTARVGLPGDDPEPPVRVRGPGQPRRNDDPRGG